MSASYFHHITYLTQVELGPAPYNTSGIGPPTPAFGALPHIIQVELAPPPCVGPTLPKGGMPHPKSPCPWSPAPSQEATPKMGPTMRGTSPCPRSPAPTQEAPLQDDKNLDYSTGSIQSCAYAVYMGIKRCQIQWCQIGWFTYLCVLYYKRTNTISPPSFSLTLVAIAGLVYPNPLITKYIYIFFVFIFVLSRDNVAFSIAKTVLSWDANSYQS